MSATTPYTPPKSAVADRVHAYGQLSMFSAKGRIGRVRYLGWTMGFYFLFSALLGIVSGMIATQVNQTLALVIQGAGILALVIMVMMFVIQRLHDLEKSGWLSLLMLIPLVNMFFGLYVLFAPGSSGANRYGNPPPPNTTGVLILAWLMPAVMIIGIAAAIAIPAYQAYVQKSKQGQIQSPPAIEQPQQ